MANEGPNVARIGRWPFKQTRISKGKAMQCASPSCEQKATFHLTWIEDRRCAKEEHLCENHAKMTIVPYVTEPTKSSGTPRTLDGATEFDLDFLVMTEISEQQVVYLREVGGSRRIPIIIGMFEATALDRSIKHEPSPRPQTHDVTASILTALGCELEYLLIHKLENHTYFADLHIRQGDRRLTVDVRPSDGFVLAVLLDRPIFVTNEVAEKVLSSMTIEVLDTSESDNGVVVTVRAQAKWEP
jgi:bifunctional DNase/RNase